MAGGLHGCENGLRKGADGGREWASEGLVECGREWASKEPVEVGVNERV